MSTPLSPPRALVSPSTSRSSLPVLGFESSGKLSGLARASVKWPKEEDHLPVPGVPLEATCEVNVYNVANRAFAAAQEVPSTAREMPMPLVSSSRGAGSALLLSAFPAPSGERDARSLVPGYREDSVAWPVSGVFLDGNKKSPVVVTWMPESAKGASASLLSASAKGDVASFPLSEWPLEPPVVVTWMPRVIASAHAHPPA